MKRTLVILLMAVSAGCYSVPETESPVDVVLEFDACYGRACMDDASHLTTAGFRDDRPKGVWWQRLGKHCARSGMNG